MNRRGRARAQARARPASCRTFWNRCGPRWTPAPTRRSRPTRTCRRIPRHRPAS